MTAGKDRHLWPVRIQTLGQFKIETNGEPVRFGPKPPRKPIELLKVLVALGGNSVSVELLCETLWPDADGDKARSSFASTLSRLRKLIGMEVVVLQDARLSISPEYCWVDVDFFTILIGRISDSLESGEVTEVGSLLDQAISLYKGPFLDGEFDYPEVLSARERLHELFLRHIEKVAKFHVRADQLDEAIDVYRKGLAVDDVAEDFYRNLMLCCRQSGRLAEGIAAYQRCREIMQAKYDIAPSEETDAVYRALLTSEQDRPVIDTPTAELLEPAAEPSPTVPIDTAATPPQPIPPKYRGERRIATVAFFDLHGYTELNERLDPEEVEKIMSRIKEEGVRIVESHGGIVNQFVGDEVLALFGIPVAHEDDASRAVRVAMELNDAISQFSAEVEERTGFPLQIHAGIDTGLVVTSLRDGRDGLFGITGDTVNTGSALASLAKPGEILVSPQTRQLIEPYFRMEALDQAKLKGKSKPLTPYRIIGESVVKTRFQASEHRGLTPFIGREHDLGSLQEALARVMAGQGQFVTVVGEPGVGKSRLLYELEKAHEDKGDGGLVVLSGRCHNDGSNTPYLPFLEALRNGLVVWGEDPPEKQQEQVIANVEAIDPTLLEYLPVYLHLLSIPSDEHLLPGYLQGEELRRAIQLALVALIIQSAGRQSILLVLEDWHWVDDASHAALKYLVGAIAQSRLMVAVSYRPDFSPDWGNVSYHTRLVMNPLKDTYCEPIVAASLGASLLPDGLAALIHARTGGNPLFVEEVCRALQDEGTITVREGEARLEGSLENLRLPDSVQSVIRSRLDHLDPVSLDVLHLAAVIGREFSVRIIQRLFDRSEDLLTALEVLKNLEIIQQVRVLPEAHYVFKHAITQEVAYETLLLEHRKNRHRQVAEAIEALYGERSLEVDEALAMHYRRAEVWPQAAKRALAAALTAKEHYAYGNAFRLSVQALEASEKMPELQNERKASLALMGDLKSLLGEMEPANQFYEQALDLESEPAKRQFITNKRHRPRTVERNGAKICYYEHGGGPDTLLLANPIVYGLATFQPVLERLCQDFRIITIDLRGSGASDPLPERYSMTEHMLDVQAVIEDAGAAPVYAIGISRGTNLLIKLAVSNPHLIKAIITLGGLVDDGGPGGVFNLDKKEKYILEFRKALKDKDKGAALQIMVPTVISEPGTEDLVRQTIDSWNRLSMHTLLSFYSSDPESNIVHLLDKMTVPTLVMHGTEDRRIPLEVSHYLAEHIPGALLYHFRGVGHLPVTTAAGEFCEVLKQFIHKGTVPNPVTSSYSP